MDYKKIQRLNEDHEFKIPAELLNMTVSDMLDKVGELDTEGDAEYEIIEDALKAISNKMGSGYEMEDTLDVAPEDTVEIKHSEDEEINSTDDDKGNDDFPTYDDITGGGNSGKDDISDFEF